MRNKRIIAVATTVIIVNLFIILIQWSDSPIDFIPFKDMFVKRSFKIQPYDLFIGVIIILFRLLYSRYGINLSVIRSIPSLFYPIKKALDVGMLVGTGFVTYTFICPFIFQFFSDPIRILCKYTHDSIRHTFMVALIFGLLFIISYLSKNSSAGSYYQAPPKQTNTMPPPPTWP